MVFCVPVVCIVCINAVLGVISVRVYIFRLVILISGGGFPLWGVVEGLDFLFYSSIWTLIYLLLCWMGLILWCLLCFC